MGNHGLAFRVYGLIMVSRVGFGHITSMMENEMEGKMANQTEHDVETLGPLEGLYRVAWGL